MRDRFLSSTTRVAIAVATVGAVTAVSVIPASAQAPAPSTPALKTPWGEPDLQGIFTDAQRTELDIQRSALRGRDARAERGSEIDVAGAYNAVWGGRKRTGARTSMIVDPPDGRIPPPAAEAEKIAAAD